MPIIVVVINFSESSRNALAYACGFLQGSKSSLLLLNIFSFPGSISDDPMALAAMSDIIYQDEYKLQQEKKWVEENYPAVQVETLMETGVFMDVLRDKANDESVSLFVMGASGTYSDLLSWDVNIIDAFVDLQKPVLVVPGNMPYRPVHKIAFAINYYRQQLEKALQMVRKITLYTGARLSVIHVRYPGEAVTEEAEKNKEAVQANLSDLSPVYFEPSFINVIAAIDQFTAAENIDLLVVIPSRQGIWQNIFQKSHTKELVYLNHIPVLSLRQTNIFS